MGALVSPQYPLLPFFSPFCNMPMTLRLHLARPRPRSLARLRLIRPKAVIDWEFQSYIIGKGLGAFVLFYTTANWWYYRRTREDLEQKDKKKD